MTLLIPPGYALVTLKWKLSLDAEPMESTFGVGNGSHALGQTEANAIASAWLARFTLAGLRNTYTFTGLDMAVGQDGGDPVHYTVVQNSVGTGTNASLPQNCALLIKKGTALGGRQGRGRMYLPAGYLQEGLVDDNGTIDSSFRGDLQTAATAFRSDVAGAAGNMDLLHSGSLAPTVVTSLTVDTRIATQRRRLR